MTFRISPKCQKGLQLSSREGEAAENSTSKIRCRAHRLSGQPKTTESLATKFAKNGKITHKHCGGSWGRERERRGSFDRRPTKKGRGREGTQKEALCNFPPFLSLFSGLLRAVEFEARDLQSRRKCKLFGTTLVEKVNAIDLEKGRINHHNPAVSTPNSHSVLCSSPRSPPEKTPFTILQRC